MATITSTSHSRRRRLHRRAAAAAAAAAVAVVLLLLIPTAQAFVSVSVSLSVSVNGRSRRTNSYQSLQELKLASLLSSNTNTNTNTNTAVYPTARGSEVDSRKIIVAASQQARQAIWIAHCLLATRDLAEQALLQLRTAELDFETLASTLSACPTTRDDKGVIGWVHVQQNTYINDNNNNDKNEHLNAILPPAARNTLLQMVTKPGDVVLVESSRGYHLVQIRDVLANVQALSKIRQRRQPQPFNNHHHRHRTNSNTTPLTYKVETMGCQMNLADSERMEGQLQSLGLRPYDDPTLPHKNENDNSSSTQKKKKNKPPLPDVVVFNTCSIRDHAEQKLYSHLGPYVKHKREQHNNHNNHNNQATTNTPPLAIVVAGCVAQQEGEQLMRRMPEIDLVVGPQLINRLADLLETVWDGGNQVVATAATHIMEDNTKPNRQSTVAAWVNVIYGCNERCAFCIVPTTRGVEQSRPVESIVQEVTELVRDQGYQEITLLGQNIDAYGRDMIPKRKFSDLIRTVGQIPGLQRLRFVTSHPRYMSMGVVEAVADTPAACEAFHIPFQSGSNAILASMGRGHTREKYLHIVNRIRTVRACVRASGNMFCSVAWILIDRWGSLLTVKPSLTVFALPLSSLVFVC